MAPEKELTYPLLHDAIQMENIEESDAKEEKSKPQFKTLGTFGIILNTILLPISTGSIQLLQGAVPVHQIIVYRYVLSALFLLSILALKRVGVLPGDKVTTLWVIFTSVLKNSSSLLYFYSVIFIPLGTLATITNTAILWITLLISGIFLKEKVTLAKVCSLNLCTIGIICVLQPPFLFEIYSHSTLNGKNTSLATINLSNLNQSACDSLASINQTHIDLSNNGNDSALELTDSINSTGEFAVGNNGSSAIIGYILGFLSGTLECVYLVLIKKKLEGTNIILTSFWSAVTGSIISLLIFAVARTAVFPSDLKSNLLIALSAIAAAFFTPSINFSVNHSSPLVVASLLPLEIVFTFIAQYTVLKNVYPGHGNAAEMIGALMVTLAAFMTACF